MNRVQELLDHRLVTISGTDVNVATVLAAALVLLLSWWIARLSEKGTAAFLEKRSSGRKGSIQATARLVRYIVLAVGVAIAVHTLGIRLASLFTAGAVMAVAVGFAMQGIAQNFVSGIILLTERSIKPDDVVEIDGTMVRVREMAMRATLARNRWDEDLIIPNSVLAGSTVKNYTLRDQQIRVRTRLGVAYDSDMEQVSTVLEEAARALPWRDQTVEPVVWMTEFGGSSVDFTISVGIDDPWTRREKASLLNKAVWFALKDAGITIAFPQLDLHVDPSLTEALQGSTPDGGAQP